MMSHWLNGCRTVLIVDPCAAAGVRLRDALPLLDADRRISTVFTVVADDAICCGFLRAQGCFVLPWRQAVRYEFDLVLAASPHGLTGKSLLLPAAESVVRCGRAVPTALALSHDAELDTLRSSCPEAMPVATVVGDLCYDRLLASIPFRARYRQAFGLDRADKLVVVASAESTVDLPARLRAELPQRYRVAVVDPWSWWRPALLAADLVIGDCGPVTHYGAAIGLPVVTVPSSRRGSDRPTAQLLREHATPLRLGAPLPGQLAAAMAADRTWQDELAARTTSRSGFAAHLLRKAMYGLLELPEPARAVPCSPVPLPACSREWRVGVASTRHTNEPTLVRRPTVCSPRSPDRVWLLDGASTIVQNYCCG